MTNNTDLRSQINLLAVEVGTAHVHRTAHLLTHCDICQFLCGGVHFVSYRLCCRCAGGGDG